MIHISDIHPSEEIIPLFDSTQNLFSSQALRQWFLDKPGSLEELLERQDILKGFIKNTQLLKPFTYSKTEFNEVYGYIESFKNLHVNDDGGRLSKMHLFVNRKKMQIEAGKLSQLLLFLCKANDSYFAGLSTDLFPESYRKKMAKVSSFMAELDIKNYQLVVRGKGLRIKDITRLTEWIHVKTKSLEWRFFWDEFFLFEAYLSMARSIVKHGFSFPGFSKKKLEFIHFYHPLVQHPVKNELTIEKKVLVLTGPNMSGKSTLLKAIGICVYLGHIGMAVPAESCELIFFDVISISTHTKDDLANGYSQFMTEIKLLKSILEQENAGKKCFAVFDEMFKGTNEEDALAISSLTVGGLAHSTGSYFLISTHLHQLKSQVEIGAGKIAMYCLGCDLQDHRPVFNYELTQGWSEIKIGQILFRLEGLDKLLPS